MIKSIGNVVKNIHINVYIAAHSARWLTRFLFCVVVVVTVNFVVVKLLFNSTLSKSQINGEKYEALERKRQNLLQHYNLMDENSSIIENECSAGNS